ncbi:hypothetical protein IW261DRAFT_1419838 [Armillaria novae-zelandiae]|uniref:Uncharacterized protein n=1 Tax=Armillaria novae-zelandiae TaxID=153914 RepID=A0AA39P8Y1_9AGAR|nr:hypothetical protein IW261DRAFT_1419838 [Armillaria novae-zelandiae]
MYLLKTLLPRFQRYLPVENYIYANELRVLENCRKYFTLLSVLRWKKWFSTTWDCLSSPCPWLHLIGTSDGYDETTLPKILKDFAITVQTSPPEEEGKFTASEIEKFDGYNQEKLRDFSYKLVRDHAYVTKVAIALRDHEVKYLSQKKRQYSASRSSFGLQLTQGVKSMRFTDTTNTVSDRISCKPSFSPKKGAASVYSRTSARVVVL